MGFLGLGSLESVSCFFHPSIAQNLDDGVEESVVGPPPFMSCCNIVPFSVVLHD